MSRIRARHTELTFGAKAYIMLNGEELGKYRAGPHKTGKNGACFSEKGRRFVMLFAEESLDFAKTPVSSTLITFLLGIGIVFIGLVSLILIIKVMGGIMRAAGKKKLPEGPVKEAPTAPVPEGDRGEIIAAVSAAIATVMGESVSGIRIVSFKKAD
jgi:sodium pump decarboxylase gamma subunit